MKKNDSGGYDVNLAEINSTLEVTPTTKDFEKAADDFLEMYDLKSWVTPQSKRVFVRRKDSQSEPYDEVSKVTLADMVGTLTRMKKATCADATDTLWVRTANMRQIGEVKYGKRDSNSENCILSTIKITDNLWLDKGTQALLNDIKPWCVYTNSMTHTFDADAFIKKVEQYYKEIEFTSKTYLVHTPHRNKKGKVDDLVHLYLMEFANDNPDVFSDLARASCCPLLPWTHQPARGKFLYMGAHHNGKGWMLDWHKKTFSGLRSSSLSLHDFGKNNRLDELLAADINYSMDEKDTPLEDTGNLKKFTANEGFTFDTKYVAKQSGIDKYQASMPAYFATNTYPVTKGDDTGALNDRMIIIRFSRTFVDDGTIFDEKFNDDVCRDYLAFLIAVARRQMEHGKFLLSDRMKHEQKLASSATDSVSQFVKDFEEDYDGFSTWGQIYNAYAAYCEENGLDAKPRESLKKSMIEYEAMSWRDDFGKVGRIFVKDKKYDRSRLYLKDIKNGTLNGQDPEPSCIGAPKNEVPPLDIDRIREVEDITPEASQRLFSGEF